MNEYVDSDCKWALRGVDSNGKVFWYTGRAGQAFVSPSDKDAYFFFAEDLARRRAMHFNKMTDLHGIRFMALEAERMMA